MDEVAGMYSDQKPTIINNSNAKIPPRPIKKFNSSNPIQLQVQTKLDSE